MIGRSNRDLIGPAAGFADIHTHILPGVDDGAQDMSQALALLRMAYEDGTRSIFLTPHYRGQYKQNSPAWLREVFSIFCQMAQQELRRSISRSLEAYILDKARALGLEAGRHWLAAVAAVAGAACIARLDEPEKARKAKGPGKTP